MATDLQRDSADPQHSAGHGIGGVPEDDYISLRDIMIMILRHRWPIAIFVLLITLAAGIFFFCQPRQFKAEGYLQVIAPVSLEGKVDQGVFETMIVSHLHRISSAFIAKNVAMVLTNNGIEITPQALNRKVDVNRPPKTDLIRLVAGDKSPEMALAIIRQWIRLYQESIQKNNIRTSLSQIRLLSKIAQADTMEKQAAVDQLKAQVSQTAPLVTLSRAVDDRQLWNDLNQKTLPDSEALKKLSDVHIKGQEPSVEYINLKNMLFNAEQVCSVAQAKRNFYRDVERLLDERALGGGNQVQPPANGSKDSEAEIYVQTILKSSEIIQFGEPGLIDCNRGALKKTVLVFVGALFLACLVAYFEEWGRGMLSS